PSSKRATTSPREIRKFMGVPSAPKCRTTSGTPTAATVSASTMWLVPLPPDCVKVTSASLSRRSPQAPLATQWPRQRPVMSMTSTGADTAADPCAGAEAELVAAEAEPAPDVGANDGTEAGVDPASATMIAPLAGTTLPHQSSRAEASRSASLMPAAVGWLFMEKPMCWEEAKWVGCSDQSRRAVRRHSRTLEHPDIENITADNRSSHHCRRSIRPSPQPSSPGPKWTVPGLGARPRPDFRDVIIRGVGEECGTACAALTAPA